jgi:pimeloyl-ACP methyl ester carboxylesterase
MRSNDDALSRGWHTFDVNGLTQAYEVAGSGPVCVAHSGGPGINSDYLRMPLLERYFTIVYLDPIGTGRSDLLPSGEYFMPTYAHFLGAVLDHIGESRPLVLGHSHGGMVVLELAMRDSGRFGGVIAYDTAPVYADELWNEAARQMTAFAARWPDRPEAAAAARAWHAGGRPRDDAAAEQKFLADILPAYFADYRRFLDPERPPALDITWDPNRNNGTWSARNRLGAIDTPTLIICGDFDFVCPPRWSKEMRDAIPNSKLCELHESGHFGHQEQSRDFVSAVLQFVRK